MNQDEILENSSYMETRKRTFFQKHLEKIELFVLILIFGGLIFTGLSNFYYARVLKQNLKSNNELVTLVQKQKEENKNSEKKSFEVVIINSISQEVFNNKVEEGSEFVLENQQPSSYYLKDSSDALFVTATNKNKITCKIEDNIDSLKCEVEETVPTPAQTQPTPPTTEPET